MFCNAAGRNSRRAQKRGATFSYFQTYKRPAAAKPAVACDVVNGDRALRMKGVAGLAAGPANAAAAQALDQLGGRIGIRRQSELYLCFLDRGARAGAEFAVDFAD